MLESYMSLLLQIKLNPFRPNLSSVNMQNTKPHAALLASPGMGHLIPVLELGKRLVNHNLRVTVFVVVAANTSREKLSQFLSSPDVDLLDIVLLPIVDISGLVEPDTSVETKIIVLMHESLSSLRSTISSMKFRPTALIVDLFGTEALAVAEEFEMLKYVFIASNAWFLAVTIYAPALDKKAIETHVNEQQPLNIPGCQPLRYEDTLDALLDPDNPMFDGFLQVGMEMSEAHGILVNTWEDLESTTLNAFRDTTKLGRIAKAPVYPIGPLARPVSANVSGSEVLDWLDTQRTESVIYVSFGSGGTLSAKQMIELAWGLELSQQRFVWVVRPPLENNVSGAAFFSVGNGDSGCQDYLPDGFLTRTRNVGLVVPMWAPQAEILAHPSVGGFLSHCGWNSTLESIANGVPMIAWPLYAEQRMNATMLTEELGVAVRSKELPSPERVIGREEIENMVRRIMVDKEGIAMKNKVTELKNTAQLASRKGGSSYSSLSRLAKDCEISLHCSMVKAQGA